MPRGIIQNKISEIKTIGMLKRKTLLALLHTMGSDLELLLAKLLKKTDPRIDQDD